MQIYVHARSFFEACQGTKLERELFRNYRIISINSVSFPSEEPPFSEEFLDAENLLILYFDDVDAGFPNAMTAEQARAIVDFVRLEDARPIIVHCTAGISRSGARREGGIILPVSVASIRSLTVFSSSGSFHVIRE